MMWTDDPVRDAEEYQAECERPDRDAYVTLSVDLTLLVSGRNREEQEQAAREALRKLIKFPPVWDWDYEITEVDDDTD